MTEYNATLAAELISAANEDAYGLDCSGCAEPVHSLAAPTAALSGLYRAIAALPLAEGEAGAIHDAICTGDAERVRSMMSVARIMPGFLSPDTAWAELDALRGALERETLAEELDTLAHDASVYADRLAEWPAMVREDHDGDFEAARILAGDFREAVRLLGEAVA